MSKPTDGSPSLWEYARLITTMMDNIDAIGDQARSALSKDEYDKLVDLLADHQQSKLTQHEQTN